MRIGVPKETAEGERRVALVPEVVRKLVAKGHEVVVEAGAGVAALVPDELYTEAGATIGDPWTADVVVKVAPPQDGGGHDPAGQGARAGRRRGRPAGAGHRPPPRRPADRLRRAPRGRRAGAV